MREELFLQQEISNQLMEMGFDEDVVGIYGGTYKIMLAGASPGFHSEHYYYKKHGAILWAQAENWLRNKRGVSVEVRSYTETIGGPAIWTWELRKDGEQFVDPQGKYHSHDVAQREGILEAIKTLQ